MLPKISIITPSYNQGHFIEETICSVLDQGYPNLEYIIMDGGSKDNTVEVIKKYEKHITYWVSEKDKGQSDAINKGFRKATGDVINWLNSDDYYEKRVLLKIGEAFSNPATNVYCGISRIFGNVKEYRSTGTDVYADNLEKTIGWARIDQPETFFRKSCLDKIGYVDEQFHFTMDKELWIRYLMRFGFDGLVKTDELIAHFRIHGESKTNNFQEKFQKETASLYHSIAQLNHSKFVKQAHEVWPANKTELRYKDAFIKSDKSQVDKIINYYLYYLFLENYAQNKFKGAKKMLACIDEALLRPAELSHLKKIKARMLLPVFIKKIVNKWG